MNSEAADVEPEGDIVVEATKEQADAAKKGFFGRIYKGLSWLDNLFGGGNNPSPKHRDRAYEASLVFRANGGPKYANNEPGAYLFAPDHPITGRFTVQSRIQLYRATDAIGGITSKLDIGGAFEKYVGKPWMDGVNTLYGPGTPVDTLINKPFYSALDLISQTPLGDPGVIMTLESNGLTRPLGALGAGINEITALRRGVLVAENGAPRVGVQANRAAETIPTFRNLAPLDKIAPQELFPALRVQQVGYTGKLEYVILESGDLVIGRSGHISLAQGADVLAAGEAKFFQGAVKRIDNMSGHYKPTGDSARIAAEAAFNRSGFDATGRYVERIFK